MQYTNRQDEPCKKNHGIYKPTRKIMQYTNRIRKTMQYTNRQEQPYKKNHEIYKPYHKNSEIQTYKMNRIRKTMKYTNHIRQQ